MSILILNKKQRKPNLAIDMVGAALLHYKKFQRPVQDIILSPAMWEKFKIGLIEKDPAKEKDINMTDRVEFHDCIVKRGSSFMIKSMIVTLKQRVLE